MLLYLFRHGNCVTWVKLVLAVLKLSIYFKYSYVENNNTVMYTLHVQVDPTYQCHSPLMLACELGDVEMVQLLLEEGASAAFKNKVGNDNDYDLNYVVTHAVLSALDSMNGSLSGRAECPAHCVQQGHHCSL